MSHEDAAALLSEFIYQIDNLPSEVAFILEEIGHKDEKVQEARLRNLQRDAVIQKHIKQNGLLVSNPKEAPLLPKMRADQAKIAKLSDEKVALAERAVRLLEKYVVKLDGEFQRLKDMGYNLGEAEAAAQAAAQAQVAAASAAMPALDLSMNKKRLANATPGLATGNKISNMNAQFMAQGLPSAGLPSANGLQGFPTNPYAANSNPFQGTNLQNQTFQTMQAGMNNPLYPNMGQFNPTGLTPSQQQAMAQFQQQNQGQFAQMQLQAAQAAGMILPNMQGGQSARDPSRPHRPSRLSSSFSATGAGPHAQILPSTAAAHMPPSQGGAGQSQQASGSTKRVRPSQTGAGRKNKKKRIVETDDESGADDGSAQAEASEDVDAEGEEEDAEGEDDRSMLSAVPANKRNANQKGVSRAGTPAGAAGTKAQQKAAAARKAGKKQDEEEEDAEADAEGEEDWGAEVDETNADDPTLYCFCNRVSYGNMIACDNPDCKYEWFHWACVRVTKQPDDDQKWYCPECRPKMLGQSGQGMGKGNVNFQGGRVLGAGAGPYQQLQAQQQQMMMAAQQAREGSTGGRSSRRG